MNSASPGVHREPTSSSSFPTPFRHWLDERKRLYREYERIAEISAQARTLVKELRRRRDGEPPRTYNLWALREALAEVDHGD